MKPSTGTVALGLLLSVSLTCGTAMAADPGEQLLLERAAFWRSQQRLDKASETLNQILVLNPGQPDALYQLGLLAQQRGDAGGGRPYFDRLRQMAPSNPRAAELIASLAESSPGAPAAAAVPAPVPPAKTALAAPGKTPSAAQPAAMVAARATAAPPSAGHAAPPARKLPELVAVSADSDDLTTPTASRATRLSAQPPSEPREGQAATKVQVASLSEQTASDGTADVSVTPGGVARTGAADQGTTGKPVQVAQLELMPPPPVNGYQRPATATPYSPTDTLEMDIDRSLTQLQQQANPGLVAGLGFRWHDGTSGLNQLTEFGTPVEGTFSPWYTGTARLTVLPVYLDAGSVPTGNLAQFGTNPLLAASGNQMIAPGEQNAAGIGLLAGYSYSDFTGQIGTSPLGFPVTNIVGMAAYQPKFFDNTLSVRFEGLRQPVTDSILSYAGTHAALTAANSVTGGAFGTNGTWGGVVKTGGNVSAFYDDTVYGGYASVGLATVTGENVKENDQIDALLGAYFRPYKTDNAALRVGVSLYYTGFDKNLSGFTFGQGGYFSPQNFEALTFPVEYTGNSGPWSYLASVAAGVQHSNQDATAVFPNNPNAQAAYALLPLAQPITPGSGSTGPAFNVKGQIEYAIDDTTALGAAVSFDNGNNYNEVIGKLYLRKTFDWLSPVASTADPVAIARRDQPQNRL